MMQLGVEPMGIPYPISPLAVSHFSTFLILSILTSAAEKIQDPPSPELAIR